jgi:hypothetical protein
VTHELRDEIAGVPGFGEIVRQVLIEQFRAVDAGHGLGRNQQVMCAAFLVREHGIARALRVHVRQKYSLAGRRIMVLRPVHDALRLYDSAQGIGTRDDASGLFGGRIRRLRSVDATGGGGERDAGQRCHRDAGDEQSA